MELGVGKGGDIHNVKKIGYEKEEIGGGEGGKVEKRVGGKANTRQEQKGLE